MEPLRRTNRFRDIRQSEIALLVALQAISIRETRKSGVPRNEMVCPVEIRPVWICFAGSHYINSTITSALFTCINVEGRTTYRGRIWCSVSRWRVTGGYKKLALDCLEWKPSSITAPGDTAA